MLVMTSALRDMRDVNPFYQKSFQQQLTPQNDILREPSKQMHRCKYASIKYASTDSVYIYMHLGFTSKELHVYVYVFKGLAQVLDQELRGARDHVGPRRAALAADGGLAGRGHPHLEGAQLFRVLRRPQGQAWASIPSVVTDFPQARKTLPPLIFF